MTQNVTFCFPNRIDEATITSTGTAFSPALTKLQTRVYSEVTRSADLNTANTQFNVDLGASRRIGMWGLAGHNLTSEATIRVRFSTVSNFASTVADTGTIDVYPRIPFGSVPFEDESFWTGRISAERRAYYPSVAFGLFTPVIGRYLRFEISDATNAAGYIEIGRAFVCDTWTPTYNAAYGFEFGHETRTEVTESVGGNEFFDRRELIRSVRFQLPHISDLEAFGRGFDLVRYAGVDKEVFFIYDADDTLFPLQKSFPGRLRQLPPFSATFYNNNAAPFEIKELI